MLPRPFDTPDFKVRLSLHGALAKEICEEFNAAVSTPYEAMRLLEANRPGTTTKWFARGDYLILLNDEVVDKKKMHRPLQPGDHLQFVPVAAGAIFGLILGIIAVVLAATALIVAFTKPPAADLSGDAIDNLRPTNVDREGPIAPVVYGTTRLDYSILASDNTFLGRSTGTTSTASTTPFVNDNNSIFGSAARFEPDDGVGGSRAPAVVSSDVSTKQQIHIIGMGQMSALSAENILFNGTALETSGSRNFNNVRFEFRDGSDPQTLPAWIDSSAAPVDINTKLTTTRTVTTLSANLDAARVLVSVASFFENDKKGRPKGTSVQLKIEKRVTGTSTWTTVSQPIISGEYFSSTQFQYSFELDNEQQYDIAVSRITAEVNTEEKQNSVQYLNAIEIKRDQVTFDGFAVALLEYTNEAFGESEPEIEFIPDGKIIRVPSNYDEVNRTYTGVWDGTYKTAFSNNPAFCVQDIIENDEYGLGQALANSYDKFNIYALGQFCDVSVDDGQGGTEPRYTLNVALTDRKKAVEVVRDVCSVFRGQMAWDGSQVVLFTEQSLPVSRILNNTQVIDGDFEYSGPSDESTPNSVTVTYKDTTNKYEDATVTHRDHARIQSEGLNEKEFKGVGINSPGQALRFAKYVALSSGLGMSCIGIEDQADALPGEVVAVFDARMMGKTDRGGRVSEDVASTTTTVQIDRTFTAEVGRTYQMYVVLPDKSVELRDITNAPGDHTAITLDTALSAAPLPHSAWGIIADNLGPQYYILQSRGNTEARPRGSNGDYSLSFLPYDLNKLSVIEDDIGFDSPPTTTNPNTDTVPPPQNLSYTISEYSEVNGTRFDIGLSWERPDGDYNITGYDVFYTYNQGPQQVLISDKSYTTARLEGALSGEYAFFVRARTLNGKSDFVSIGVDLDDTTTLLPGRITGLELFGQGNNTVFQNKDAKFSWKYTSRLGTQEIGDERFGIDSVFDDDLFKEFVVEIYDVDTNQRVRIEEGIKENTYTYTLEKNVEDGGPRRQFRIELFYRNKYNQASERTKLTVSNPAPPLPNNIQVTGLASSVLVTFVPTDDLLDFAGVRVWGSDTSGFTVGDATLLEDTQSSPVQIPWDTGETLYLKIAQYDSYSKDPDDLNVSGEYFATPVAKLDTTAPSIPTGLSLSTVVENDLSGTQIVKLVATWDRNSDDDMNFYDIGIRQQGATDFITTSTPQVPSGATPTKDWEVRPNTTYEVRVRAVDDAGNKSGYSATESQLSGVDTTPPGDPTSLTAAASFRNIFLSWANPSDNDFSHVKIWENTANDFGTATLIANNVLVDSFTKSALATGDTYYYWVQAVDTSGNVSNVVGPASATPIQTTSADYQNLSIVNAAIADLAVDDAKIANLSADKLVAGSVIAGDIIVGAGGPRLDDPAAGVNANTTVIEPGLIQISGSTNLADWRQPGDLTKLAGGSISANTIRGESLLIGYRGVVIDGLQFEPNDPSSDNVSWSSGTISYLGDDGNDTSVSVTSGSVAYSGGTVYVYWVKGATSLSTTTNRGTAFGTENIVLATYGGGVDLVANYGRTIIDGSQIITGSVTSAQLITGTAVITESAQIANSIIGNAQIENSLSSTNWNASTKTGIFIDFANGKIQGRGIEIYDTSGDLIFSSGGVDFANVSGSTKPEDNAETNRPSYTLVANKNFDGSTNNGLTTIASFDADGSVNYNASNAVIRYGDSTVSPASNDPQDQTCWENSNLASGNYLVLYDLSQSRPFVATGAGAQSPRDQAYGKWDNGVLKYFAGVASMSTVTVTDDIVVLGEVIYNSGTGTITKAFAYNEPVSVSTLTGFAFLDQLTSGNVSTFMQSATIGSTQIGSAAIVEAKIGDLEVSTLKIKDFAVTRRAAAQSNSDETGSIVEDTWKKLVNTDIDFTSDSNGELVISGNVCLEFSVDDADTFEVQLRITRDGTQIGAEDGIAGKPEIDIQSAPEPWVQSAPFNFVVSGTGTNDNYAIEVRLQDTRGTANFNAPATFLIRGSRLVITEYKK